MPIQTNENPENGSTAVLLDSSEAKDCVVNPKNIGWNLPVTKERPTELHSPAQCNYLSEMQVSHKQITDRFVELLSLFEEYSKIVRESGQAQPKLKRSQSEQFTATHLQPAETASSELVKSTVSLNRMQLSESTLLAASSKLTCEVGIQTYWPLCNDKDSLLKVRPEQMKSDLVQQTTLHIEVESVSSAAALERAPLRQRLWQVLVEVGQTLSACCSMMGENITYVLFVLLCMWCLYLIIEHYSSFLGGNLPSKQTATSKLID
ncbi:uncharacterized protein LOC6571480 isoform X2 [Drosophila grimshawi]|uniref:uncharacterized protein LOC6571480 isoform X2 n=1 Tax=Drosophila grimshawi TaxID=7222 RepID=UPI000C86E96A|nr:uncharacterized protein LOC6571480 isoform X2 [Drosophila grimshawi]